MTKFYKKYFDYSTSTFFFINNINLFFFKLWIKGPLGEKILSLPNEFNFLIKKEKFYLISVLSKKKLPVLFSLIKNTIIGLTKSFKKKIRIKGLGFKVLKENLSLVFFLGYSHFIKFKVPNLVTASILGNKSRIIELKSSNLVLLNQTCFLIQNLKKPGIYKHKGIYFTRKFPNLKAGKKKKFH